MFCFDGAVPRCRLRARCAKEGDCHHNGSSGQATVEAAFLAPLVLAGILLLVQPGIVLYDRAVMLAAAQEGCRLLETRTTQSDTDVRAYIERRLDAIPDVGIFHSGLWDVTFTGDAGMETTSVTISHRIEPLPLVGASLGFVGLKNEGGAYRHEVTCGANVRDAWLMESEFGCDASAWIDRWNEKV